MYIIIIIIIILLLFLSMYQNNNLIEGLENRGYLTKLRTYHRKNLIRPTRKKLEMISNRINKHINHITNIVK